ncbi:MAG TPA: response regulator [Actinomycetota bacterium]
MSPTEADRPRVLLVDDDPVIVRLLEVNFRLGGFDVEGANRGEEALEKARATKPDAIVLDVMMPGLDGYQVCARLREDPDLAAVPVIFLTARAQEDDVARGYALGVIEYVTKPFDPEALVATVRRSLPRGAA